MNQSSTTLRNTWLKADGICNWLLALLTCVVIYLSLPGTANAEICTGWGSELEKEVNLGLPATIDIPVSATPGTVLASGTVAVPALVCRNETTGKAETMTNLTWGAGTSSGDGIRYISPGIGIILSYHTTNGGSVLLPADTVASNDTNGLDWQSVDWKVIRAPGTVTTGRTFSGLLASLTQVAVAEPALTPPTLRLTVNTSPVVAASCTLATDTNMVVLPDTPIEELRRNGYSRSRDVVAYITCPADTTISGGTNLTLTAIQAESDSSLVKSTGTAQGVAIEVLEGNARISAAGGTVKQALFRQGDSTSSPGATQSLSVRMVRNPGETVSPGSVKGTFTLTLTVN